jgi:iron complex transport system substrate-binding protein
MPVRNLFAFRSSWRCAPGTGDGRAGTGADAGIARSSADSLSRASAWASPIAPIAVAIVAALLVAWMAQPIAVAQPSAIPSRIVSTSPSITETLFALGLGDHVVGVSSYCRYPEPVNRLPRVGSFLKPDTEAIVRLHPDLVIVHAGPHTVPQQLAGMKIRTALVDRGNLAGVYSSTRIIGQAAGVPDRAASLVATIQRRLETIRESGSRLTRRRVLLIVGREPGTLTNLIGAGPGSFLHDVIAAAGGVNVLGDKGLPEYPQISMESVIRLAPDVIVDAGDMGDSVEEHRRRQPFTERLWREQPNVAAGRRGDVHAVTSDAFVVPGPRVVDAAGQLGGWLQAASARR